MFFFRYHGMKDAHTIFSGYHHQARWKILRNNNIKFMRVIGIWIKNALKGNKGLFTSLFNTFILLLRE